MEENKKPDVFNQKKEFKTFGGMSNLDPSLIEEANKTAEEINEAVRKEGNYFITHKNDKELSASLIMKQRREEEKELVLKGEKIKREHLSEDNLIAHKTAIVTPMSIIEDNSNNKELNELIEVERQLEQLKKLKDKLTNKNEYYSNEPEKITMGGLYNVENENIEKKENNYDSILDEPRWDDPYDTLPLPSRGKIYKGKEEYIKVAYMTTEDEDLLSSPNMLRNPDFLKILFNRKILSKNIRYQDLHIGDRNAIMLWLRSTSYGSNYPVTFMNPNFKENEQISKDNVETFDATIDLSSLPIKYLDDVDTDENGHFSFITESKNIIKFKFLNLIEMDEIEKNINEDDTKKVSFFLNKIIVSIDGNKDKIFISDFIKKMRTLDSRKLRQYYNNIESGVDLRLHVAIPGGGSLDTFLPFTTKFFWPD